MQKTTHLLIPRAAFERIIREIVHNINDQLFIQKQAYEALQQSAEMYLVQTFEDAQLLAIHRRCVTVDAKDMNLVRIFQPNRLRYQTIENVHHDGTATANAEQNNANEDTDASDVD